MLFLNLWALDCEDVHGVLGTGLDILVVQSQCQCKGHECMSGSQYVKFWVLRQGDCKFKGDPVSKEKQFGISNVSWGCCDHWLSKVSISDVL